MTQLPSHVRGHFLRRTAGPTAPFTFEVASTPEQQAQGLMHRAQLPAQHGMLFAFTEPSRMGFWMKNTFVPLDIAWLSAEGVVEEIGRLTPHDETLRRPARPAKYVVELGAGTFLRHGVHVGDQLVVSKPQV